VCEGDICEHEEEFNHLRELLAENHKYAKRLWEWMTLSDRKSFRYEYPDMAKWIEETTELGQPPTTTT
jgi:hypothetical protein